MTYPVSGQQVHLRNGVLRASITTIGASLRELTAAGRPLIVPFDADEIRPSHRGATVAPWPNRIVDGSYSWAGKSHQLPLNEVARGHAIHGLTSWLNFEIVSHSGSVAELSAVIEPQPGYPWRLRIDTTFTLDGEGLTQEVLATNLSGETVPYGLCPHPYLIAGSGRADDWTLTLPAGKVLTVSEPRLIPESLQPVEHDAARFDFRTARKIGDVKLDHAFTELTRDEHERAAVQLMADDGSGVTMSWGEELGWVQIYTADNARDTPAHIASHRAGVAVEPMSCAPDAFHAGAEAGLVALASGATHTASWTIAPVTTHQNEKKH